MLQTHACARTPRPLLQVHAVVNSACAAMLLAALHRVSFSVLAVPIQVSRAGLRQAPAWE